MRCELLDIDKDFDAILVRAAEAVKKCSVKGKDKDTLYAVLGHVAANLSMFSEVVGRIVSEYENRD